MYLTAISDLRDLLSDGSTDRYNYRKRCFGQVDGINVAFKTFDFRRATDFTIGVTGGEGVYIDGYLLPATGVANDNLLTGEFTLVVPPSSAGSIVEASYYNQWFLDSELDTFLQIGARWIQDSSDYTQVPDGLVSALLKYAAAEAYLKMAQRWRTYLSQGFKVEDAPKDSPNYNTDSFTKMSETFRAEALQARNDFYNPRQGRALAPLFGSIRGRVRNNG